MGEEAVHLLAYHSSSKFERFWSLVCPFILAMPSNTRHHGHVYCLWRFSLKRSSTLLASAWYSSQKDIDLFSSTKQPISPGKAGSFRCLSFGSLPRKFTTGQVHRKFSAARSYRRFEVRPDGCPSFIGCSCKDGKACFELSWFGELLRCGSDGLLIVGHAASLVSLYQPLFTTELPLLWPVFLQPPPFAFTAWNSCP